MNCIPQEETLVKCTLKRVDKLNHPHKKCNFLNTIQSILSVQLRFSLTVNFLESVKTIYSPFLLFKLQFAGYVGRLLTDVHGR